MDAGFRRGLGGGHAARGTCMGAKPRRAGAIKELTHRQEVAVDELVVGAVENDLPFM